MVEFLFEESWRTVNSILPCSYASWQDDWICSNRIHQTWTLEIVEQPKDIKTKRIPSCIYYPIYIDINIQFMMEKSNGITKMKIRPPVKATKISSHVHSSLSLSLCIFSGVIARCHRRSSLSFSSVADFNNTLRGCLTILFGKQQITVSLSVLFFSVFFGSLFFWLAVGSLTLYLPDR